MCLELNPKARKQKARKDIIVYKALRYTFKGHEFQHNDNFTGIIDGYHCEGKISIDEDGNVFFCTNHPNLDGRYIENKLGYKNSWVLDSCVTELVINGIPISRSLKTPYKKMIVEMGKTYTSELERYGDLVEQGLHSFEVLEGADNEADVVAKCIIPKGSYYYKGTFDGYVSFASDTLKYIEIINK